MKKECISKNWLFSGDQYRNKPIDLPHDYSISLPRDPDAPGGQSTGFFSGTAGTYVKYFDKLESDHTILHIDGAYMCARVKFNEDLLVMHPHGYTPFLVDLTDKSNKDKPNKIEIMTYNAQPSTRWYSGAGLYRDVFLWTGGKVRIEPWDMFITTTALNGKNAEISVKVKISSDIDGAVTLQNVIYDPSGKVSIEAKEEIKVTSGKTELEFTYEIADAMLWDAENPNLYKICSEIVCNGKIEDTHEDIFGIRTVTADAVNGLLVNGKQVKLRGGCIHHDHGALGAAAFPAAEYRKLRKLKDAGYNAVRISHNPPSLALLEICDRLGLYVMDEAFDMWNDPKSVLDYSLWFSDWYTRDIESMVLRDRNHPCVISYSIGNEIPERDGTSDGAMWSERLVNEVRKHDDTKLVTSAICGFWLTPDELAPEDYDDSKKGMLKEFEEDIKYHADKTEEYAKPLDIVGYNYLYERYEYDHERFPDRVMWGSETHALNIYHSWKKVMDYNYVLGDFTWTAYDNLGEVGTGRSLWASDGVINGISLAEYPWRTCYQGDFDLAGYRRPQSYFRERVWIKDCEPKIFTTHPEHYGEGFSGTGWHWYDVSDSWTFADEYIGKPVKVDVYTDADEVQFELNGKVIGAVKTTENVATIDIPYEKGELKAISYRDGKMIKTSSLHTVGKAENVMVVPETDTLKADNRDLCYFDITITDSNGDRVPYAENEVFASVSGGELMCIFGGNPANDDDYASNICHTFYGRCVAVVRTKTPGDVEITVISENLKTGKAKVKSV